MVKSVKVAGSGPFQNIDEGSNRPKLESLQRGGTCRARRLCFGCVVLSSLKPQAELLGGGDDVSEL